jgi:hypothetical protein
MIKEGLNKRGQNVSVGFVIVLFIAIIVAIVIVLGSTGVLGDIFGKRNILPGNLEAITQSCRLATIGSLVADYCYGFKEVDDDEYINCQDPRVKSALEQQGVDLINCPSEELVRKEQVAVCEDVSSNKRSKVTVNGETCSDILGIPELLQR